MIVKPKKVKSEFSVYRCLYQTYFFFVGLALVFLSSYVVGTYETSFDYYNQIIANWNMDVIVDIQLDSEKGCKPQSGLQVEYISYDFPGTTQGCDCRDIDKRMLQQNLIRAVDTSKQKPKAIFSSEGCSATQLNFGCLLINSIPKKAFNTWGNGINLEGFRVCLYRLNGYNTINNINKYSQTEKQIICESEEKLCGGGFCVPKQSKCPITQLQIIPTLKTVPINSKFFTFNSKINVADGEHCRLDKYLTLQIIRSDQKPIVDVMVTEGDGICFDNSHRGSSSGRQDFQLMNNKKKFCSKKDTEFRLLHSIDEETLYTVNGMSSLPLQLPGFQIDAQYRWSIYTRQSIEMNEDCYSDIFKDLIDNSSLIDFILYCLNIQLIINVVFFFTISVVLTIVSCANIYGYDWPCIKGKDLEESNTIFKIEVVVKTLIQIPQIVVTIYTVIFVYKEVQLMDNVITSGCTTQIRNDIFIDLKDYFQKNVFSYCIAMVSVDFVTTVVDIAILTYMLIDYNRNQKNKPSLKISQDPEVEGPKENINDNTFSYLRPPQTINQRRSSIQSSVNASKLHINYEKKPKRSINNDVQSQSQPKIELLEEQPKSLNNSIVDNQEVQPLKLIS